MKKLKLNLEELKVESFITHSKGSINNGTVHGNATGEIGTTCDNTCPDSCEACVITLKYDDTCYPLYDTCHESCPYPETGCDGSCQNTQCQ
ncbi:MAG: pinensin family lanthipeptide [Ignavibacteria bacterium]|jgi:hypothetical protein